MLLARWMPKDMGLMLLQMHLVQWTHKVFLLNQFSYEGNKYYAVLKSTIMWFPTQLHIHIVENNLMSNTSLLRLCSTLIWICCRCYQRCSTLIQSPLFVCWSPTSYASLISYLENFPINFLLGENILSMNFNQLVINFARKTFSYLNIE